MSNSFSNSDETRRAVTQWPNEYKHNQSSVEWLEIFTPESLSQSNNPSLMQSFEYLWKLAPINTAEQPNSLIPFHLIFCIRHQTVCPLHGRWGTCDGSQLFTHHSSLETLPFSLKNKYLLATGVCDGKWISGLDINTRIGSGKSGGGGPRSQCLVLSGKAPRRLTHSEKRERTPDPVCLNCMLKWGLSINISTQRNGRMLSHVQLMYTHTWHTHMLANSWVYTVACITQTHK